jgi:hypothetical protein
MYITYVYGCTVESVTNAIDNFSTEHNYNIVFVVLVTFLPRILIFILQYFPNVLAGIRMRSSR